MTGKSPREHSMTTDTNLYADEKVSKTVKGVQIFKSGLHRDSQGREKEWSKNDIDNILQTFDSGIPSSVPVKLGHTSAEHNALVAESLGLPEVVLGGEGDTGRGAATLGKVTAVYQEGDSLVADLEVSDKIAGFISDGLFTNVSSEILDDYQGNGPALSGLALLGAERPALKDMSDLSAVTILDDGTVPDHVYTFEFEDRRKRKREKRESNIGVVDAVGAPGTGKVAGAASKIVKGLSVAGGGIAAAIIARKVKRKKFPKKNRHYSEVIGNAIATDIYKFAVSAESVYEVPIEIEAKHEDGTVRKVTHVQHHKAGSSEEAKATAWSFARSILQRFGGVVGEGLGILTMAALGWYITTRIGQPYRAQGPMGSYNRKQADQPGGRNIHSILTRIFSYRGGLFTEAGADNLHEFARSVELIKTTQRIRPRRRKSYTRPYKSKSMKWRHSEDIYNFAFGIGLGTTLAFKGGMKAAPYVGKAFLKSPSKNPITILGGFVVGKKLWDVVAAHIKPQKPGVMELQTPDKKRVQVWAVDGAGVKQEMDRSMPGWQVVQKGLASGVAGGTEGIIAGAASKFFAEADSIKAYHFAKDKRLNKDVGIAIDAINQEIDKLNNATGSRNRYRYGGTKEKGYKLTWSNASGSWWRHFYKSSGNESFDVNEIFVPGHTKAAIEAALPSLNWLSAFWDSTEGREIDKTLDKLDFSDTVLADGIYSYHEKDQDGEAYPEHVHDIHGNPVMVSKKKDSTLKKILKPIGVTAAIIGSVAGSAVLGGVALAGQRLIADKFYPSRTVVHHRGEGKTGRTIEGRARTVYSEQHINADELFKYRKEGVNA